jgi:hypothetical protein
MPQGCDFTQGEVTQMTLMSQLLNGLLSLFLGETQIWT